MGTYKKGLIFIEPRGQQNYKCTQITNMNQPCNYNKQFNQQQVKSSSNAI
jgi:hypothetical protein